MATKEEKDAEREKKRARALELRALGMSIRNIASELKIGRATASYYVRGDEAPQSAKVDTNKKPIYPAEIELFKREHPVGSTAFVLIRAKRTIKVPVIIEAVYPWVVLTTKGCYTWVDLIIASRRDEVEDEQL